MDCLQCGKDATAIDGNLRECRDGHRTGIITMPVKEYKAWQKAKRARRKITTQAGETANTVYDIPELIASNQ